LRNLHRNRLRLGLALGLGLVAVLGVSALLWKRPVPRPPELVYHSVQAPGWPTALEVPLGFTVTEIASGLKNPRFMVVDADGSIIFASESMRAVVRLRDLDGDGRFEHQEVLATGLPFANSVAFVDGQLYAAAEDRVVRLSDFGADGRARRVDTVIGNLPSGITDQYGHRTRTLVASPDGKLFTSVGSSCDICEETEPMRATLLRSDLDGKNLEIFAHGLRNTVGFAVRNTADGPQLWGFDMGRNNLGVGIPPERFVRLEQGRDYGWPYCVLQTEARGPADENLVPKPDPYFEASVVGDRCQSVERPRYTFPAHWAPLGIVFYAGQSFPSGYRGDALVAFHGTATDQTGDLRGGYNVVRLHMEDGAPVWDQELLRGFVTGRSAWGRPTGVTEAPDGSLLVSDDTGGRIFRIRYTGEGL
jgi:glucose/arabinose dehydrogenase